MLCSVATRSTALAPPEPKEFPPQVVRYPRLSIKQTCNAKLYCKPWLLTFNPMHTHVVRTWRACSHSLRIRVLRSIACDMNGRRPLMTARAQSLYAWASHGASSEMVQVEARLTEIARKLLQGNYLILCKVLSWRRCHSLPALLCRYNKVL